MWCDSVILCNCWDLNFLKYLKYDIFLDLEWSCGKNEYYAGWLAIFGISQKGVTKSSFHFLKPRVHNWWGRVSKKYQFWYFMGSPYWYSWFQKVSSPVTFIIFVLGWISNIIGDAVFDFHHLANVINLIVFDLCCVMMHDSMITQAGSIIFRFTWVATPPL